MNNETILEIIIRLMATKKYKTHLALVNAAIKEWHDTYPYDWVDDLSDTDAERYNDINFLDVAIDQTTYMYQDLAGRHDEDFRNDITEIYIDDLMNKEKELLGSYVDKLTNKDLSFIETADGWAKGRDVLYSKKFNEAQSFVENASNRWLDAEIGLSQAAVNRETIKATRERLSFEKPEYVRIFSPTGTNDNTIICDENFGVFPTGSANFPPFHPNCRCEWETVSKEDYNSSLE